MVVPDGNVVVDPELHWSVLQAGSRDWSHSDYSPLTNEDGSDLKTNKMIASLNVSNGSNLAIMLPGESISTIFRMEFWSE